MPGFQPPAPKERPVVLAGSSAPQLLSPAASTRKAEDYGAIVLVVLVVLGLIAAGRAFMLLGA